VAAERAHHARDLLGAELAVLPAAVVRPALDVHVDPAVAYEAVAGAAALHGRGIGRRHRLGHRLLGGDRREQQQERRGAEAEHARDSTARASAPSRPYRACAAARRQNGKKRNGLARPGADAFDPGSSWSSGWLLASP
jgi:hypothetical protein